MSLSHEESEKGQILLYQTDDQGLRLECRFVGETLWLSLKETLNKPPQSVKISYLFSETRPWIKSALPKPNILRSAA